MQRLILSLFSAAILAAIFGADVARSSRVVDFDKHFQKFAQKYASDRNRRLEWADPYGKHEHLASRPQYSMYKIDVEYLSINYKPVSRNVARPGFVFEQWYHNGGSEPLTGKFTKTKSITSSFTWSVTEGLKIGTENTFKAGLPGVVGGDLKFKTELELSSTQGKTKTDTDTFSVENQIPVAPGKSVKAVFTVVEREVEVPWDAMVQINGWCAIWLDPKYNGHWLWFIRPFMCSGDGFFEWGNSLRFKTEGVFKGVRGVETVLTTQECDNAVFEKFGDCMAMENIKMVHHKYWNAMGSE